MVNPDKGPILETSTQEQLKEFKTSVDFQVSFKQKPLEYQKNFLNSLVVLRESNGGSFAPYTKDSLAQITDSAYVCEILLAMNMRDAILNEAKNDPSWVIAPYSEEQLRNIDPIYAAKTLQSLNTRNEQLKNHGTGDMKTHQIGELLTDHPKAAFQQLFKKNNNNK